MKRIMAIAGVAVFLAGEPSRANAQWDITPHAGVSFGTSTSLFDPDNAADRQKPIVGIAVTRATVRRLLIEGDVTFAPEFFEGTGESSLVSSSDVLALSGGVMVLGPAFGRAQTYISGAAAAVRIRIEDLATVFATETWRPALTTGGGVSVRITDRLGLRADVRYLTSRGGEGDPSPVQFGFTHLDFWRVSAGLKIRID